MARIRLSELLRSAAEGPRRHAARWGSPVQRFGSRDRARDILWHLHRYDVERPQIHLKGAFEILVNN